MAVTIRPYAPRDAIAAAQLYLRSVEAIGPRDYTAAQVDAWASLAPTPEQLHARFSDGRAVFIAADAADAPAGFMDLEADGHIDMLYCAPKAVGAGVAAALYEAVETLARDRGVARLYSEASEAARRFFLKRGFVVLHRRDLEIAGRHIHNFAVEKILSV
jgi:putative acetyltransferase